MGVKKRKQKIKEVSGFPPWAELEPDILAQILNNLSLKDQLMAIPSVCKPLGRAMMGPYCWQEIDIKEWSELKQPEIVHKMLQLLIERSCGSLHKLCVCGLSSDASFSLIADNAKSLQILELPSSGISDVTLEQLADKLASLTFLDLSRCKNVSARGLEANGNSCKNLTNLQCIVDHYAINEEVSGDMAHAITTKMHKLKQLNIMYFKVSSENVEEIILNCKEFESLDIQGCWKVDMDEKLEQFPWLKVEGPSLYDESDDWGWGNYCDCCCSDSPVERVYVEGYMPYDSDY